MQRQIVTLLSLMFLASCGGDNPAMPDDDLNEGLDKNLVGTWIFEDTDMVDTMALGFAESLRNEGVGQVDVNALASEIRTAMRDNQLFNWILRFNADGSFEDNQGDSGTWRVEGNILIDDDEERINYFVDGDNLTLIYPSEVLLDALLEDESLTDEVRSLFSDIFDEDTKIRVFFKRR